MQNYNPFPTFTKSISISILALGLITVSCGYSLLNHHHALADAEACAAIALKIL